MQVETTRHGHRNHQHVAWSAYVKFNLALAYDVGGYQIHGHEVWLLAMVINDCNRNGYALWFSMMVIN